MSLEPRFHGISHSSENLRVQISAGEFNWEGEYNEWWGIDHVEVIVNTTSPEPATLGLAAVASPLLLRRRRRSTCAAVVAGSPA